MPLKGSETKGYLLLGRKAVTNLDSILKSRDITLLTNVCLVKAVVFPVVMLIWELDYKESWGLKNWCLWIVVLEKTPESPLDSKEIKLVNLKGNQPWILIGRDWCWGWSWSSSILVTCRLTGEVPDAGKDWGQEKRASEDEMAGWHNWCNGRELGQTLGDGEGQGVLASCHSWSCKELGTTGWLNKKQSEEELQFIK